MTGAAFRILFAYVIQGSSLWRAALVFRWRDPSSDIRPPILTAVIAVVPALMCRLFLDGIAGQVIAGLVFLAIFGVGSLRHRRFAETGVMRRVFLTGASSGIGLAIAELLVEEGDEISGSHATWNASPRWVMPSGASRSF